MSSLGWPWSNDRLATLVMRLQTFLAYKWFFLWSQIKIKRMPIFIYPLEANSSLVCLSANSPFDQGGKWQKLLHHSKQSFSDISSPTKQSAFIRYFIVILNKFVRNYLPTGKVDIKSKEIYKINYGINYFHQSQNLLSTNLYFFSYDRKVSRAEIPK